jgi:NADH-quinone oxidoreductase subunit M
VAPLVALIVVLGVYPQPLIDLIEPAVADTVSDVGGEPGGVTPDAVQNGAETEAGN